jgi:hypothetical protein
LNFEDVDRVPHASAIGVADEEAIAGNAEAASVTGSVQVATLPRTCRCIADRWHREDPVQVIEVAKQMQLLLQLECAGLCVGFRRGGIDLALTVDADRRHLRQRRVKRARLAAGRIFRVIDALLLHRGIDGSQQGGRQEHRADDQAS